MIVFIHVTCVDMVIDVIVVRRHVSYTIFYTFHILHFNTVYALNVNKVYKMHVKLCDGAGW